MYKSLILNEFEDRFKTKPYLFSSPGRINLIGEHADYNDGFVLPAAIDKHIYFAIAPNKTTSFNIISYDLKDVI